MNPITHLLISWTACNRLIDDDRDRRIAAWSGVMPDLDGIGAISDILAKPIGFPQTAWYETYHHSLFHGLFGAVLIALNGTLFSHGKMRSFAIIFMLVHLHLFCDLVGARGPTPEDIWTIPYLMPFSEAIIFSWDGQWPLDGWPNILLSILLLAYGLWLAALGDRSPVELLGKKAESHFKEAISRRMESSPFRKLK